MSDQAGNQNVGILMTRLISVSKQYSPRCDAAFCGVSSGAILLPMSQKKDAWLIWVNTNDVSFFKKVTYKLNRETLFNVLMSTKYIFS